MTMTRPVVGVEVAHATLDLVPVGRGRLGVGHRQGVDLGKHDLDASALGGPELIAAGVEEQPVQPGLEAIGVAQGGQVPPAADERLLDGVLGAIGVPQDESRGGVHAADRGACQHGEGVMIALLRSLHEVSLHVRLDVRAADLVAHGAFGATGVRNVPSSTSAPLIKVPRRLGRLARRLRQH